MSPNESEPARHAEVMNAWAEHQRTQAGRMGAMMGMGGMTGGGSAGTCQRNADGSFTLSGSAGMMR